MLMSVLVTHVRMVVPVTIWKIATSVIVLKDGLVSSAQKVC